MTKIKVAELFYSIQGEGRYMGVPSIFLRVFGCNFRCAGFGLPRGMSSTENDRVFEQHKQHPFQDYKELPLVSTGCDSYASWDVRFKDLSPMRTTDDIVENTIKLLPNKKWQDEHFIFTGGEPLLGWQRSYPDLLDHPQMQDLKEITFETNGTQKLKTEFKKYLKDWASKNNRTKDSVTFSVSAKLSVSGEKREDAILPEVVAEYGEVGHVYLKFVVADLDDAREAIEVVKLYRQAGFAGSVYLMPVGGVETVYHMNNRTVAELAMKMGYRYSDRLQVPLFKNAWGT